MYEYFHLALNVERLVGGIPKHPDIVRRWQEARMPPESKRPADLTVESATEATVEALGSQALDPDEEAKSVWTGFVENPETGEIALETRNVKAMFKESANILRDMKMMKDLVGKDKAIPLRARLAERLFVFGPSQRGGWHNSFIPIEVPEERRALFEVWPPALERPIHVMTARGQRTALKKTDYVDDCSLEMELKVLNDGIIHEGIIRMILEHAAMNGLGTDRSQGNGMFSYELTKKS